MNMNGSGKVDYSYVQITSGVPMPVNGPMDVIAKMSVGDSFFLPAAVASAAVNARAGYYRAARAIGIKVIARTVTEDGITGFRVWRSA